MNLLCYLQDMNAQTGPLRVIPASHLGAPPTPVGEATWLPHPQEQLLDLKAGDLVVIHSDLIHSGTPPTDSTRIRMYGLRLQRISAFGSVILLVTHSTSYFALRLRRAGG